jgi:Tfp pilus assembly protein PilV
MPALRHAGFALLDTLVALLLLAVVLTGSCATLIQSMRATGAALLSSRAADLAADFTEELRSASSASEVATLLTLWRTRVATLLPVAGMQKEEFAALQRAPVTSTGTVPVVNTFLLTLRWQAPSGERRQLTLPVALAFSALPS